MSDTRETRNSIPVRHFSDEVSYRRMMNPTDLEMHEIMTNELERAVQVSPEYYTWLCLLLWVPDHRMN